MITEENRNNTRMRYIVMRHMVKEDGYRDVYCTTTSTKAQAKQEIKYLVSQMNIDKQCFYIARIIEEYKDVL